MAGTQSSSHSSFFTGTSWFNEVLLFFNKIVSAIQPGYEPIVLIFTLPHATSTFFQEIFHPLDAIFQHKPLLLPAVRH